MKKDKTEPSVFVTTSVCNSNIEYIIQEVLSYNYFNGKVRSLTYKCCHISFIVSYTMWTVIYALEYKIPV